MLKIRPYNCLEKKITISFMKFDSLEPISEVMLLGIDSPYNSFNYDNEAGLAIAYTQNPL